MNKNQSIGRAASGLANTHHTYHHPAPHTPLRDDPSNSDAYPSRRVNGNGPSNSDEDIPENMYRPDKDDPEGWIHRDKLAKIESEELQAAGINLATARSRSQSRNKNDKPARNSETGRERDEKRQRLQSPVEIEEEGEHEQWDFRLPEEIEADGSSPASQMYSNPVLRKSGSKIPVLTSSPLPIPAERYERDTPIARKRTASGTMSLEGDLSVPKTRIMPSNRNLDDSDATFPALALSKPGSPQKPRSKSGTTSTSGPAPKTLVANRKVSAPPRASPTPGQRPSTRSGEPDRPRTAVNRPEGDPPWLATMYKPDPLLPPDQQLIPTLAKKQLQAQWAEEGAVPKAYDRDFTPSAVYTQEDLAKNASRNNRTPSPAKQELYEEKQFDQNTFALQPIASVNSNKDGRPDTSGSITGGYSTMPKVTSPAMRDSGSYIGSSSTAVPGGRPTNAPPPPRMQAQNLADDKEDEMATKKGCGCCTVM